MQIELHPENARRPTPGPPVYVDTRAELERACRSLGQAPALGVDTEFVRERTFFPGLGLIQICDGATVYLVDPVALKDLEPLWEVFADPEIVKVVHSGSEDMEVFYHRFGALPAALFDTQIAAAFSGLGFSLSYQALVDTVFGVEVPKGATRTNWLRRPLSGAQLDYAALDVAWLLPLYDVLDGALGAAGRRPWLEEEVTGLSDTSRFLPDPQSAYLRVKKGRGLSRAQLGVLRALAAWREQEARRRDLPRNFVLREAVLPDLARRAPSRFDELRQARLLHDDELRRHGKKLIEIIRRARDVPPEELPPEPPPVVDLSPYRRQIDALRREVKAIAGELDLPPELVATRRSVERLVRRRVQGAAEPLPRELRGWRRPVVGERLLAVLGKAGI